MSKNRRPKHRSERQPRMPLFNKAEIRKFLHRNKSNLKHFIGEYYQCPEGHALCNAAPAVITTHRPPAVIYQARPIEEPGKSFGNFVDMLDEIIQSRNNGLTRMPQPTRIYNTVNFAEAHRRGEDHRQG
jgi:hypothetical protein